MSRDRSRDRSITPKRDRGGRNRDRYKPDKPSEAHCLDNLLARVAPLALITDVFYCSLLRQLRV